MLAIKKDLSSIRTNTGKINFNSIKAERSIYYTAVHLTLVGSVTYFQDADDYRFYDFINLDGIEIIFTNFKDGHYETFYKEVLGVICLILYFADLEIDLTADNLYRMQIYNRYDFNSHDTKVYLYTPTQWGHFLYGTRMERIPPSGIELKELIIKIENNKIIISLA